MKIALLTSLLLFSIVLSSQQAVYSQLQKGNILLEGGFGNAYYSNSGIPIQNRGSLNVQKNFSIGFYPTAGLFLTDHLVVGTQFSIGVSTSGSKSFGPNDVAISVSKYRNFDTGLKPFVRYYFGASASGKSVFYGQASLGTQLTIVGKNNYQLFDTTGTQIEAGDNREKVGFHSFGLGLTGGWNRFLTDNVALNLYLGYNLSLRKSKGTQTHTDAAGTVEIRDYSSSAFWDGSVTWGAGLSFFLRGKGN
jgi:hypothetical protein